MMSIQLNNISQFFLIHDEWVYCIIYLIDVLCEVVVFVNEFEL